jgi:sugar lactone lactonase YvrE
VPLAAGNAGCKALVDRISTYYTQFLKETWGPKVVRLLREALEDAASENASLGLPAYDQEGPEHAQTARESAVLEAKRSLEQAKDVLVRACCAEILASLKAQLVEITSENLMDQDPCELPCKWSKQRQAFESACNEAVEAWGDYWAAGVERALKQCGGENQSHGPHHSTEAAEPLGGCYWAEGVDHALEQREKENQNKSAQPAQATHKRNGFQLGRFPAFISAIQARLALSISPAKVCISTQVQDLIEKYYSKMSPWVNVTTNLRASSPTVSLTCYPSALVENVVLTFIENSTDAILHKLPADFSHVSAELRDGDWVESCAATRRDLASKIKRLSQAKKDILAMLGVEIEADLLRQYVTGFRGNLEGLAVDEDGNIFVADRSDHTVKVYSIQGSQAILLRSFGDGYLCFPHCVAIGARGMVYVCNFSSSVSVFKHDGTYVLQFGQKSLCPSAIAIDDVNRHVYVSSESTDSVHVFNMEGRHIRQMSDDGKAAVCICRPRGVLVGSDGYVYVANSGSQIVGVFDTSGVHVKDIGHGLLQSPSGLAMDSDGALYVRGENGVKVFDGAGVCMREIMAGAGSYVAVDQEAQVLVTEWAEKRLLRICN